MARKKKVENAGTYAAKKRGPQTGAITGPFVNPAPGLVKNGAMTSASGTPGPAGVLTTGHYSSSGQRMYGGYGPTGRGRPRGLETLDAQANRRARRQLPGAR